MDKTKRSLIILVSILALCTTTSVLAQPAQFMTYGHVFYENSSEYNNIPCVSITNQNTNEEWQAETNAVYYQPIFANGTNVNISEVLQFEVKSPNGCQSKVFNHTINEGEVNNGEFFKFNIPPYMAIPPSITGKAQYIVHHFI